MSVERQQLQEGEQWRRPLVLLFDFDGVLLDSRKHTLFCIRAAQDSFRLDEITNERFDELDGMTMEMMWKELAPENHEALYSYYKTVVKDTFEEQIQLFDTALEVLGKLKNKGCRLGLVTSRGKWSREVAFNKFDLGYFFEVVIDREDVKNHKPHPEPLYAAYAAYAELKRDAELTGTKISPYQAIYIGDTLTDVVAARLACMRVIWLTDRVQDGTVIEEHKEARMITGLQDLLNMIEQMRKII